MPHDDKPLPFLCQNCGETGDEDDFTPTDGSPAPHACPRCGGVDVFFSDEDDDGQDDPPPASPPRDE